jgi:isoleucyl-tRNA synthetase
VRVSRRRFWSGDAGALTTLHTCLLQLSQLLAPFVPFTTDEVWGALGGGDSVHLSTWPSVHSDAVDGELAGQMALVRRLVDLGRAARAESKTKTRQPLARALVSAAGWEQVPAELRELVATELNVVTLERLSGDLVDVSVKANFRALGKRFGKDTQKVADAVRDADGPALAAALQAGEAAVEVDGVPVQLSADELIVTETPRTGWAVASGQGETVALDLELTPELRRAGLVRDAVRLVQDGRKSSGLEVSDRIELWWAADGELAEALREGVRRLADEVLAVSVAEGRPTADLAPHVDAELGLTFWLRVAGG